MLLQIQNLSTVGASEVLSFQSPSSMDWYVVVANEEDDSGNPNVDSFLYRWSGTTLELVQNLPTIGASAVTTYSIDGTLYLAVTSFADTRYSTEHVTVELNFNVTKTDKFSDHKFLCGMETNLDWTTHLTLNKLPILPSYPEVLLCWSHLKLSD